MVRKSQRQHGKDWNTDLLLRELVGEISNHDLGLGRNAVGGRAALPTLLLRTVLVLLALGLLVGILLVRNIRQRLVLSSRSGLTLGSLCGRTLLASSPILETKRQPSRFTLTASYHPGGDLHHDRPGHRAHGRAHDRAQRCGGEYPHRQSPHQRYPPRSCRSTRACEQAGRKPCAPRSPFR